ncbi:hypothetical protein BpHYR1_005322 [Brachionus plicatilis]|uniref:Uncharacterized protein n=1 Tax=Brachionus plicatilis TaxID=10195 RepID=A0A3M7QAD6_BRAPC|nr:hypothetical protein BpHYR1_005322 [Brachionus plicatilis]
MKCLIIIKLINDKIAESQVEDCLLRLTIRAKVNIFTISYSKLFIFAISNNKSFQPQDNSKNSKEIRINHFSVVTIKGIYYNFRLFPEKLNLLQTHFSLITIINIIKIWYFNLKRFTFYHSINKSDDENKDNTRKFIIKIKKWIYQTSTRKKLFSTPKISSKHTLLIK